MSSPAKPTLSSHEVAVLALLAHGKSASETAQRLGVSLAAVSDTVVGIRQRLGVSSTAAAVRAARGLGVLLVTAALARLSNELTADDR